MCGIAGYIGSPDQAVIEKMTRSLVHRGPEDEGYFVNGLVALGMRRLKIIDLEGGHQPMYSADKSIVVVYNGEIYNFQLLRAELEKSGVRFQTASDTEVFVHGYKAWGAELFKKLDGMFAVAIWDDHNKQLILARDRFGEKPLYYGKFSGSFIFGSELKAVLEHPSIRRDLNQDALAQYLVYDYAPAPLSIFRDIFKLPSASYMVIKDGQEKVISYWQLAIHGNPLAMDQAEIMLRQELERAVTSRMIADVPLGVFLSGGLDSSTIAYFAQKNSSQKIRTFSIGFDDTSFDESSYAARVAEFLGTDHTAHTFTTQDCLEVIPEIFTKLDEPFADASILPTYLLSKFTRQHVTVALDGDGSDELFGGYPTFQARKFLPLYDLLPKTLLNPLIQALPTSFDNITLEYGLKRIAQSSAYPALIREFSWIGSFLPYHLPMLLARVESHGDPYALLSAKLQQADRSSDFEKMLYLYQTLYLQDDILVKSDRASMLVSLESRAPFLANGLADLVNRLPQEYKQHGLTSKYLLKQVMRPLLPPGIADRKKKGFGVPMARWLNSELKPLMSKLLDPPRIKREGYFNPDFINRLVVEHEAKKKDHRKLLWNLIAFQLWQEHWLA